MLISKPNNAWALKIHLPCELTWSSLKRYNNRLRFSSTLWQYVYDLWKQFSAWNPKIRHNEKYTSKQVRMDVKYYACRARGSNMVFPWSRVLRSYREYQFDTFTFFVRARVKFKYRRLTAKSLGICNFPPIDSWTEPAKVLTFFGPPLRGRINLRFALD